MSFYFNKPSGSSPTGGLNKVRLTSVTALMVSMYAGSFLFGL